MVFLINYLIDRFIIDILINLYSGLACAFLRLIHEFFINPPVGFFVFVSSVSFILMINKFAQKKQNPEQK